MPVTNVGGQVRSNGKAAAVASMAGGGGAPRPAPPPGQHWIVLGSNKPFFKGVTVIGGTPVKQGNYWGVTDLTELITFSTSGIVYSCDFDIQGCTNLTTINILGNDTKHLVMGGNAALTNCYLDTASGRYLDFDVSGATGLLEFTMTLDPATNSTQRHFSCPGTALASLVLTAWHTGGVDITAQHGLENLYLDHNDLSQGQVDAILVQLAADGNHDGHLSMLFNSIPSSTGLAAKATLIGRGWTVAVDS